jgi:hypothetical protein
MSSVITFHYTLSALIPVGTGAHEHPRLW